MKIDNTIIPVDSGTLGRGRGIGGTGSSFSDFLAKAVSDDSGETSAASGASALTGVSQVSGASLPALWQRVDNLLSALDNYAEGLGDPSLTLKDLEPLASDLEQRADDVDQGLSGNGLNAQGADELANLAMQAVTQARVEAFKFRRGDYL